MTSRPVGGSARLSRALHIPGPTITSGCPSRGEVWIARDNPLRVCAPVGDALAYRDDSTSLRWNLVGHPKPPGLAAITRKWQGLCEVCGGKAPCRLIILEQGTKC